jgi:hypothetical protein
MRIKTKISLRIDDDLLKILKDYSSNNLTACIESLIWKGLMTDLAEANQQLRLAKASKNLENNQCNDFEKEMQRYKESRAFFQRARHQVSVCRYEGKRHEQRRI